MPTGSGTMLRDRAESCAVTKTATPDEAASLVRRSDTIGFGLGPGNPDAFLAALGERDDWDDLVLGGALLLGYYTVLTKPGVSYRSGFFGPAERLLLAQGHNVELVPGGFRQYRADPRAIRTANHGRSSRAARRRGPGEPVAASRSDPKRTAPSGQRSEPRAFGGGESATARAPAASASIRQHPPRGVDRRPRRGGRRAFHTGRSATHRDRRRGHRRPRTAIRAPTAAHCRPASVRFRTWWQASLAGRRGW